jgi:hypothetical protein
MVWYYYDNNGMRIEVESATKLKDLAARGFIQPEMIIENGEGKRLPASKVKGLIFSSKNNLDNFDFNEIQNEIETYKINETTNISPGIPDDETPKFDPICRFKQISFTRKKSLEGITDKFKVIRTYCGILEIIAYLFSVIGIIAIVVGIIAAITAKKYDIFVGGFIVAFDVALVAFFLFVVREMILLFVSIEKHIRYQTTILDDIIDNNP